MTGSRTLNRFLTKFLTPSPYGKTGHCRIFCNARFSAVFWNRSDRIRTCGLYVPNVALYQAEPHSDKIGNLLSGKFPATEKGLEPLLTESESAVLPITPFRIICCPLSQATWLLYQTLPKNQALFLISLQSLFSTDFSVIIRFIPAILRQIQPPPVLSYIRYPFLCPSGSEGLRREA